MINWELLSPRNFFMVALFSIVAYMIFNYFAKQTASA